MFSGPAFSLADQSMQASRTGLHNGNAGWIADHPPMGRRSENTCRKKSTQIYEPVSRLCAKTQGTILGDVVVVLDVKSSRRRYGAERA